MRIILLPSKMMEGEYHSVLHYLGRQGDSQYPLWEAGIRAWLTSNPEPTRFPKVKPGSESSVSGELNIEFMTPDNGDKVGQAFTLHAKVSSKSNITTARVFLDNSPRANYSGDFGKSLTIEENLVGSGALQSHIKIEAEDKDGNSKSSEIIVFF